MNEEHIHNFEIVEKEYNGWGEVEEYHLKCSCGEMIVKEVFKLREKSRIDNTIILGELKSQQND